MSCSAHQAILKTPCETYIRSTQHFIGIIPILHVDMHGKILGLCVSANAKSADQRIFPKAETHTDGYQRQSSLVTRHDSCHAQIAVHMMPTWQCHCCAPVLSWSWLLQLRPARWKRGRNSQIIVLRCMSICSASYRLSGLPKSKEYCTAESRMKHEDHQSIVSMSGMIMTLRFPNPPSATTAYSETNTAGSTPLCKASNSYILLNLHRWAALGVGSSSSSTCHQDSLLCRGN